MYLLANMRNLIPPSQCPPRVDQIIPFEDPSHDIGLVFVDDQILVIITIIAETGAGEGGGVGMRGTSLDTPFDVGTLVLALCLGQCCMECQQEFPYLI